MRQSNNEQDGLRATLSRDVCTVDGGLFDFSTPKGSYQGLFLKRVYFYINFRHIEFHEDWLRLKEVMATGRT